MNKQRSGILPYDHKGQSTRRQRTRHTTNRRRSDVEFADRTTLTTDTETLVRRSTSGWGHMNTPTRTIDRKWHVRGKSLTMVMEVVWQRLAVEVLSVISKVQLSVSRTRAPCTVGHLDIPRSHTIVTSPWSIHPRTSFLSDPEGPDSLFPRQLDSTPPTHLQPTHVRRLVSQFR